MFGVYRRCEVPHSDGGGEDTLNGDSVERSVKFHGDGHLLEQSEEEHPLVSLLDDIRIDEFIHFEAQHVCHWLPVAQMFPLQKYVFGLA